MMRDKLCGEEMRGNFRPGLGVGWPGESMCGLSRKSALE